MTDLEARFPPDKCLLFYYLDPDGSANPRIQVYHVDDGIIRFEDDALRDEIVNYLKNSGVKTVAKDELPTQIHPVEEYMEKLKSEGVDSDMFYRLVREFQEKLRMKDSTAGWLGRDFN